MFPRIPKFDYSKEFYLERVDKISEYIKNELGGTIKMTEDKGLGIIKLRWRKFVEVDGSTKEIAFDDGISYRELETIVDPLLIGKRIVEYFRKREERLGM